MGLSREKQKLLQRLQNSRLRTKEGLFLVEGVRGAQEFLAPGARSTIRFAVFSPRLNELQGGPVLMARLQASGLPVEVVEDQELWAASATEQPQGVLLVVEEPSDSLGSPRVSAANRVLVLDGIQDPGNVGTLLRAARAFELDVVVVLDGSCDPWNPKAVRASAGAAAHIRVLRESWESTSSWIRGLEVPLLVAEPEGKDVRRADLPSGWALVMGGEGGGVREEIRAAADQHLAIPMAGGVDSLNVAMAGAILLFSLNPKPKDPGKP